MVLERCSQNLVRITKELFEANVVVLLYKPEVNSRRYTMGRPLNTLYPQK
jgi:hypothetical protein